MVFETRMVVGIGGVDPSSSRCDWREFPSMGLLYFFLSFKWCDSFGNPLNGATALSPTPKIHFAHFTRFFLVRLRLSSRFPSLQLLPILNKALHVSSSKVSLIQPKNILSILPISAPPRPESHLPKGRNK